MHTLWKIQKRRQRTHAGFTLIEMLVAVALFAVVMLVAGATLLSLVYANRKAQALQSVMNNLNISLDEMVRSVRMGSNYRCGSQTPAPNGDCSAGNTIIYYTPFGQDPSNRSEDVAYAYDNNGTICGANRICVISGGVAIPITAPEVAISNMTFFVVGTTPHDNVQPKVVITLTGSASTANSRTKSNFSIQATAVQRLLDL
ncbi:MAG TPA: type II secretion system protein [Candidatus Paceibacterota bacterium]|nr:type II secretion system protein [Candidatus Paceibacterota bacterium]